MASPRYAIGVSLKMYFSHARTVAWCHEVANTVTAHPAIRSGEAEVFVIPSFLSVPAAVDILGDVAAIGVQDIATEDFGAFTGEVSAAQAAELGCTLAEIGHAERRQLFGETPEVVRQKTAAAYRNGITPVLCVGEKEKETPHDAAVECAQQVVSALDGAPAGTEDRLVVAYEPFWAIGAVEPASPDYITGVCTELRTLLEACPDQPATDIIYGGSAGPGLLTTIAGSVNGLFLGRFAHDPQALSRILDEVHALTAQTA